MNGKDNALEGFVPRDVGNILYNVTEDMKFRYIRSFNEQLKEFQYGKTTKKNFAY